MHTYGECRRIEISGAGLLDDVIASRFVALGLHQRDAVVGSENSERRWQVIRRQLARWLSRDHISYCAYDNP